MTRNHWVGALLLLVLLVAIGYGALTLILGHPPQRVSLTYGDRP